MFTAGEEDTRAHAEHDGQQPEPSNAHLRSLRLCDPPTEIVTGAQTRQTCTVPNHSVHWTTRPRARFGPGTTAFFDVWCRLQLRPGYGGPPKLWRRLVRP